MALARARQVFAEVGAANPARAQASQFYVEVGVVERPRATQVYAEIGQYYPTRAQAVQLVAEVGVVSTALAQDAQLYAEVGAHEAFPPPVVGPIPPVDLPPPPDTSIFGKRFRFPYYKPIE